MADYGGEYGHPYPRVDEYGNPVPPVDQYGNPIPREPSQVPAYSSGGSAPSQASGDVARTGTGVTPGYRLSGAVHPHESVVGTGTGVSSGYSLSGAAHPHESVVGGAVSPGGEGVLSGGLAPGETTSTTTTYASEGMVGSGIISTGDQIHPAKEEHITLGETLRRTASSSSSSSSEDDGQGGRQRRKKSIKDKIKEKLPGNHKQEEHAVPPPAGTGTHEKKGIIEKIKEKLPGHH